MENQFVLIEKEKVETILDLVKKISSDISLKREITDLKLLDSEQAADTLGVSESTLKNLRRDGRIDYVQQGTSIRFTLDHIKDYIEANTKKAFNRKGGMYDRI